MPIFEMATETRDKKPVGVGGSLMRAATETVLPVSQHERETLD